MAGLGVTIERTHSILLLLSCIGTLLAAVKAEGPAPVPEPTSDGYVIDQFIAWTLLIVALVLTYLIHPLDAYPNFLK